MRGRPSPDAALDCSNGVTNYPVTVTLDDAGELIPGMNVTGTILLDEAKDVLAIPADSLMRGNRVYVKDASAAEGGAGGSRRFPGRWR